MKTSDLDTIFEPVLSDLDQVGVLIVELLANQDDYVHSLMEYLVGMKGKMFRPALCLLTGKAVGHASRRHVLFGAIVEMIHTATLIHDDVLDEADMRRGVEAINSRWGNETSIMLGDLVFARSIVAMKDLPPYVFQEMAGVISMVCEGELAQLYEKLNVDLSIDKYLAILKKKTAVLCGSAAFVSARLAGVKASHAESLRRFGTNVGLAFQIVDDCLDIMGTQDTGKMLWNDLKKGKLTLPFLYLIDAMSATARRQFHQDFMSGKIFEDRDGLRDRFVADGILDRCYALARDLVRDANLLLHPYQGNPCCSHLMALADFVVTRRC